MNKMLMTVAALSVATATHAQTTPKDPKATAFWQAYTERDSTKARALAVKFLQDYPIAKTDRKADKANFVEYYKMYDKVLSIPTKDMNKNVKEYLNELPYFSVMDFYYHKVTLYDRYNVEPLPVLLERSELVMQRMKYFKDHEIIDLSEQSAEERQKRYNKDYYEMIYVHMGLLKKMGRNAEALKYAQDDIKYYGYKVADLNDALVQLLQANGKESEVQHVLEESVRNNQSTPRLLELLRKKYTGNDFDAYLASLKDKDAQASLEEHIKSQLIKKELPEFTVYDVNGKKVSSKDWKGKRVVLDFWASWCLPCKAAFPGMKMAQEKLASQPDVAFYFVVVHEHKAGYKNDVKKFIEDNHYPFTILFDGFDDDKSSEEAAKLLNVTGIPHKMVLDKNGMLRFSMTGYYGSPSQLADEVVMMVNMIK